MEYEWVKTATGWRIFWGIDPEAITPKAEVASVLTPAPEGENGLLGCIQISLAALAAR